MKTQKLYPDARFGAWTVLSILDRARAWWARIGTQHLGLFDTFAEAVAARRQAEAETH